MTIEAFIEQCEASFAASGARILRLTQEEIDAMPIEDMSTLIVTLSGNTFIALPEREREFFEWLRTADPEVWDDLWLGEGEPYIVSIDYLLSVCSEANGFPICDLVTSDNYFFTPRHIKKPDGELALIAIMKKIEAHRKLSIGEALMYEAARFPIDLWHFCYRHKIPVGAAKLAVAQLVADELLVHLTQCADLVDYIDF